MPKRKATKTFSAQADHTTNRPNALLLGSFGYQVKTAHSAAEGIAAVKHFQLDVAFLDIGLPDMTGYDLARTLRGGPLAKQATLVAMTGWGPAKTNRGRCKQGSIVT